MKYIFVFATLIVLILSSLYLHYEWHKYHEMASSEAVQLAQSLESLLHPEHIEELSGSEADIKLPEYSMAKTSLMRLVDTTNPLRFGHCTIAEGVEYESQLQYLKEHSCDRIQGYLFSKPLNEEDALEFLKSKNKYDCHSNDSRD